MSFNKLKHIVNLIFLQQQTEDDVAILNESITISGDKNVIQNNKDDNNINIEQARDIHIGDIHQALTVESIKELISLASNNILLSQNDMALSISISNDFTEDAVANVCVPFNNQEKTLSYQINEIKEGLQITPQMEYLSKLENNLPISDLTSNNVCFNSNVCFKWQFPNLDLRLVNNTNKTIYITDIFLEVEKSVLDPYPVLIISTEETNQLHFLLVNDGWGEVKNALVRFNLVPWGHPISFLEAYQHEIYIGDFLDCYNVDISQALSKIGVEIKAFSKKELDGWSDGDCIYEKGHFPGMPFIRDNISADGDIDNYSETWIKDQAKEFLIMLEALGSFREGKNTERNIYSAIAYGEISFTGTTHEGKSKPSVVKFSAEVPLLIFGQYGDNYSSSFQYSVKLDVDRENYKVVVQGHGSSVSQFLKTGEIDRFNIRVGASKSSLHDFRLKLIYNNGQSLLSPPISLKIFVPKSEANSIRNLYKLRLEQGEKLAEEGDLEGAILKFQEALRLNSSLDFDPRAKALHIVSKLISN